MRSSEIRRESVTFSYLLLVIGWTLTVVRADASSFLPSPKESKADISGNHETDFPFGYFVDPYAFTPRVKDAQNEHFGTDTPYPYFSPMKVKKLGSEFVGKRSSSPLVSELDQRSDKRRMGSEFLGKRRMGSEFLGKRLDSEFVGKQDDTSSLIDDPLKGSNVSEGEPNIRRTEDVFSTQSEQTLIHSTETDDKWSEPSFFPVQKRRMGSEFLGKRRMGSEFLGKRRMGSEFLGKRRMGSEFLGKRGMGSEFLGKRRMGSEFLGKRGMGSEFLGKRRMGSEFLGKRGTGSEFLGKRRMGSEFLGKRRMGSEFLGKRRMGSEFLGKRRMGSEFLGKRRMGSEFLGKRRMGSEFLGKRSETESPEEFTLGNPVLDNSEE